MTRDRRAEAEAEIKKGRILKPHPAANLFPMMSSAELDALAADIAEHGQHERIILTRGNLASEDLVLDGRNRLEACRRAKVEPEFGYWEGDDDGPLASPTAWVISKNLKRRHLTPSQIALVGADALPLFEAEAKARQAVGRPKKEVSAPGRSVPAPAPKQGFEWWRQAGDLHQAEAPSGRIYRVVPEGPAWAVETDGDSSAATFTLLSDAKAACEAWELAKLEKKAKPPKVKGKATAAAATAVGSSSRSVERAKAVIATASKEQIAKIRSGEKTLKQVERETKRAKQVEQIKVYRPPLGEFGVIVADPPWPFEDALDGSDGARAGLPYPQQKLQEICETKIPAASDCVLWLWCTNTHLIDGSVTRVLEAWGFTGKTILTWDKMRMGAGRWLRNSTEHCVLAVKGSPVVLGESTPTILQAPRGAHSAKPEAFYELVEKICPSPSRLELNAREARKGWASSGAELPAKTDLDIHREMANAEPVEGRDFTVVPPARLSPPKGPKKRRLFIDPTKEIAS